jgi:GAF domain-containing protein
MPDREQMMVRQRVIADFGDFALRRDNLDEVLAEACRLVGEALGTDLAKILEIEQDQQHALVKAGAGWRPGIVGEKRLSMGERSSEAYSIKASHPVITEDIGKEDRFELPDILKEHGVVALVNVPIFLPGGQPYGLLQVDSREPREFAEEDIQFLRTYATILGPVIDRLHKVHPPPGGAGRQPAAVPGAAAPGQEPHRHHHQPGPNAEPAGPLRGGAPGAGCHR